MKTFAEVIRETNPGDKIRVVSAAGHWDKHWPVGQEFEVGEGFRPVTDACGGQPPRGWTGPVKFEKVVVDSDPFIALEDMLFSEVAALMKAHNDGKAIKFRSTDSVWISTTNPSWDVELQYALALTPEQVREGELVDLLEAIDKNLSDKRIELDDRNSASWIDDKFNHLDAASKGRLLLAAHNGASFQTRDDDGDWESFSSGLKPSFNGDTFYRVVPEAVVTLENDIAELNEKRDAAQDELNELRSPSVKGADPSVAFMGATVSSTATFAVADTW